jgi:hypothetical protein
MRMLIVSTRGLAHVGGTPVLPGVKKMFVAKLRHHSGAALLSLALSLPMLLPSAPALAQVAGAASPARRPTRGYKRSSLDDRVRTLSKNLDLSEAQQSAVKKILEERQQEILRMRLDPSIAGSARIDKFRALQEKTVERIRAVLNEEQKKKYDPLAVRRLPPAPQQRSVEDWFKATPQQ